jgi:hypothetical protein
MRKRSSRYQPAMSTQSPEQEAAEKYLTEIFDQAAQANRDAVVEALVAKGIPRDAIARVNDGNVSLERGYRECRSLVLKVERASTTNKPAKATRSLVCAFYRRGVKTPKTTMDLVDCQLTSELPPENEYGASRSRSTSEYPVKRKGQFDINAIADRIMELRATLELRMTEWFKRADRLEQHQRDGIAMMKRLAQSMQVRKGEYSWQTNRWRWSDYLGYPRGGGVNLSIDWVEQRSADILIEGYQEKIQLQATFRDQHGDKCMSLDGLMCLTTALRKEIPADLKVKVVFDKQLVLHFDPLPEAQILTVLPVLREMNERFYPEERKWIAIAADEYEDEKPDDDDDLDTDADDPEDDEEPENGDVDARAEETEA